MLSYPVRFIPAEDGTVIVRFPDVPEAAAVGADEDEALASAAAILETVLATYCVDGRPIPHPSDICGAPQVTTEKFSLIGMEVPAG